MRGHVRKRGNSWSVVVDVGRDDRGRRKQKWHSGFATRRDAQRALAEIVNRLDRGAYVEPTRQTFGEFVAEWLPAIKGTVRASTFASYESQLRSHALPSLGGVRLQDLSPSALNQLYSELQASGRSDGKGGLSPRSVVYVHTIIRRALRDAVRWGKLTRNVADLADPPRGNRNRREMRTWTPEELRAFLDYVREDRLSALWMLLATTGARRGEALGLRWQDVDLESGRASIRQGLVSIDYAVSISEPKTDRGRRSVPLADEAVTAVRAWRKQQTEERLALGPAWQDNGLVFTREDGVFLHPDRVSKMFERHAGGADLPRIRLHDLRHTWATCALRAGVAPKVVSEILGHSSIAVTLDVYSHAIPSMQEDATALVANLIFADAKP